MPQKTEFPENDEIIIGTVKKIFPTTVFVTLDEFNKEGVIPISEISPGRIRNIRDFVKEKRKIICKVLKVEKEKGHITLSLRRVTLKQKKDKTDSLKKEKIAQSLINEFAKKTKLSEKQTESLKQDISKKFPTLFEFLQTITKDPEKAKSLIKNPITLIKLAKERIKEKKLKAKIKLQLSSDAPNGIKIIKTALQKAPESIQIKYISAPLYSLETEGTDIKALNQLLKKAAEEILATKGIKGKIVK